MKVFEIKNDLSERENILSFIEYVKSVEKENGLSCQEIKQKYTHSDCRCLVSLINSFFPNTNSVMFLLDEEDVHFVASLDTNSKNGEKQTIYFDINGEKSFSEVCAFLLQNFGRSGEIIIKETTKEFIENDVTQKILNSVEFENVENEKQ